MESVIEKFLGNTKSPDYKEIVRELLINFKEISVNMSLKIHFLDAHIDFFPENLGSVSDEHGERFHRDVSLMETRYSGKNACHMLATYCWSICRDQDNTYKRSNNSIRF